MSLFSKLKLIVKELLQNPHFILYVLDNKETKKSYVINKYGLKQGLPTINILELCPSFNETVFPFTYLDGTSLPTDIGLLKALARQFQSCNYLELGSWRGESLANVASIAKNCVSVSLSKEELTTMGVDPSFVNALGYFTQELPNVLDIGANTFSFDFESLNQKFDLIFVDADHHYESVKNDTQKVINLLKDENSIIVWHDYSFGTEKPRWEVLAGILDGMPKELHSKLYHVSNTMTAIYTNRSLNARFIDGYEHPDKVFEINLTCKEA